jgi:UDP-N-acetylglucosamine 4,6-dehydratase
MLQTVQDPMLSGASVLVTGGTGSFGRRFVDALLRLPDGPARVVVFSRDELKQYEMSRLPGIEGDRRMRFFLGDVRDKDRVRRAFEGVDVVVHAAALKQVPAAEYNPFEFIKTNVLGAQNVVDCAMDTGVSRVVALSTDKAAAPVNLYGATKLCSDKLFVAANAMKGSRDLRMSVVRYGNVLGSRGSVVPFFLQRRRHGVLPITDLGMTRFNLTLDEAVAFVLDALATMRGGEIFVPRLPSYRITDMAKAVAPECRIEIVGVRPGEKLHEEMITPADSFRTAELTKHFVILPSSPLWDEEQYLREQRGHFVAPGFHYESSTNTEWLSIERLRSLVHEHLPQAEAA